MQKLIYILLCTLISPFAIGVESKDTVFTSSNSDSPFFNFNTIKWNKRDTGITPLQVYQPAFRKNISSLYNGNIGLAVRNMIPQSENELGFRAERNVFDFYMVNSNDVKYYNTKKPFTSVNYIQGSKKEQVIEILHTQNLNSRINVGFNYNRVKSDGFYARQNTSYNNVVLFSSGSSKKGRFNYLGNIIYNKLIAFENWGLVPDSSFESLGFGNKSLLQINNAYAQNNRWSYNLYFKPFININKIATIDSTKKESQYTSRVFLEFKSNRFCRKYLDPFSDKLFYNQLNYDSLYTNDSSSINKLNSFIGYETNEINKKGERRKINYSVKIGYEYFDVLNYNKSELLNKKLKTTYLGGKVDNNIINNINIYYLPDSGNIFSKINFQNIISGYNKGDWMFNAENTYTLGTNRNQFVLLNINLSSRKPDFFQTSYYSNTISFINDTLLNIKLSKFEGGYINDKLKLNAKVSYQLFDNFVYYDYSAKPTQLRSTQDLLSFSISEIITFKKFNWRVNLIYNLTSFGALRVPSIITYNSLYFENRLFKKSTLGQIGFDIRYFSKTDGLNFHPSLSQYYLSSKPILNYPFVDFFLNFKVSTFRMFFKIEHINAGFLGNNYYVFNNLPMNDRAFKIGVLWTFHY